MAEVAREVDIGAYSAYAIAVEHGYEGTEEEWIAEVERNRIASAESAQASANSASESAQSASDASDSAAAALQSERAAAASAATSEAAKNAAQAYSANASQSAESSRQQAVLSGASASQAATKAAESSNSADEASASAEAAGTAKTGAERAAERAENAELRQPTIGANGNWWTWNASTEEYQDTGLPSRGAKGETGAKGDTGRPFQVAKVYASRAEMEADYSGTDVEIGEFVVISSTVSDPDNATLWLKDNSAWQFITDMSGAQGIKGDKGEAGDSAYQQAVDGGYSGTEAEFNAQLAGFKGWADAASGSASSAAGSASAAKTSEDNAAASASTAVTKAGEAATSAATASTKAGEASGSATAAAGSATAAQGSANSAEASATAASGSAAAAAQSAQRAENAAVGIETHEQAAKDARDDAVAAKTAAETARDNAAASAGAAAASAANAATSETNARSSASGAAASETNAAGSATTAQGSASAASTSATNAAQSASAAAASATAAKTDADRAEAARDAIDDFVDVTDAAVGDVVRVSAVDGNGVPTAWQASSNDAPEDALPQEETGRQVTQYLDLIARDKARGNLKLLQQIVRAGRAARYFSIGEQVAATWTDTGGTSYDNPHDIVDMADVVRQSDGATVPGLWLQAHWLPPDVQVDAGEAFYVVTDEALPAGTYYIVMGDNWGGNIVAGKTYSFTLANPVPVGGQLVLETASSTTWGGPDQAPANWRLATYTSALATTPIEKVTLTEGAEGTELGTLSSSTKYGLTGMNNMQRAAYGYNRWSQSAIRQWCNSAARKGNWWTPQNPYDRPPMQLATMDGYMAGLPEELLAVAQPVKVTTALNTASDSEIGTTEETWDTFFLPSLEQEYCVPQLAGVEGSYWPYWKERLGTSSPQASGTANANVNHVRHAVENHNSAQAVRLRSATRGTATAAWIVTTTGYVDGSYAAIARRPAPACVIC